MPDLATSQVRYQDARGSRPERDTDNVPRRAGYIQIRGAPTAAHNRIDSLLDDETVESKLIHLPRHRRLAQRVNSISLLRVKGASERTASRTEALL